MKRKLLFLATSLCVSLTLNAQTIDSYDIPMSIDVGSNLEVTVTYTVTDAGKVSLSLEKYDSNDEYVSGVLWEAIDAEAGTHTKTIIATIPDTTPPSSSFTNGENYKVIVSLVDATGGNLSPKVFETQAITLTGTATVAPTIDSSTIPMSVEVGSNLEVTVTYTVTDAGKVSLSLEKYDSNDAWDSSVLWEAIDAEAGTHTKTIIATVPDTTPPSSSFTNGENYKVTVSLNTAAGGNLSPKVFETQAITLTAATAGIEDINTNSIVMYPNPVSDILRIRNVDVSEVKSFKIVDILGKVVIKQNNDKKVNSIDTSKLSKGLYFLISNNNRQFKFIKN